MTYKNNVKYSGQYGGISVTFSLSNFTPAVTETFNKLLAEEAVKRVQETRQTDRCSRI